MNELVNQEGHKFINMMRFGYLKLIPSAKFGRPLRNSAPRSGLGPGRPRILMGISFAFENVSQGTPAQRTSKGCVDKQRSDTICASRRSARSIVVVGS